MKVWLNTRLVDEHAATVSVFDHGFLYGDGIYETVKAYDYRVFHWDEHYRRLKQSARSLSLSCPWASAYLLSAIGRVLRANHAPNASVRVTVARGPGPLGLDPRVCPKPTLVMLLHPDRPLKKIWTNGVSIGIPRVRRNHPACLDPQIKSNNSLNTILAKIEGTQMGVFETVLLNLEGYLTEGTTSNIFFVQKGKLYTPAVSCGLLEGVTRGAVLKLARKHGILIAEGRYTPQDLLKADEVFLSSTTLEIAAVTRLKLASKKRFQKIGYGSPGPITRHLHTLLRKSLP